MSWSNHYQPPTATAWTGRHDAPVDNYFFQVISTHDLNVPINLSSQTFALLGFCCDEGIRRNHGRQGAATGPFHLRKVLANMPLHRDDIKLIDVGDIVCHNENLEEAQVALGEAVSLLLNANITPIILGGGHELAYGHYQGIEKVYRQEQLGMINFDAHFDMRPLLGSNKGTSGTPFLQIAKANETLKRRFDYYCIGIQNSSNTTSLFETARQYHTHIILAEEIDDEQKIAETIHEAINENEIIYVSICLDVFASAFAPGVSAPQSLGVAPWQVIKALRKMATSGKVISYDIAELSPPFDIDSRTAKLAANLMYDIVHHHQFVKR